MAGTTRNDGGSTSGDTDSIISGVFWKISLNSSNASCWFTKVTDSTAGLCSSASPMASRCSAVESACRKTMNSMPPSHRAVAFSTPWRMRRAPPTSASDTATVATDASVRLMLRRRLFAVSRAM